MTAPCISLKAARSVSIKRTRTRMCGWRWLVAALWWGKAAFSHTSHVRRRCWHPVPANCGASPPALCRAGQPSQFCGAGVDHGHGCSHGQAAVQPLQTRRSHLSCTRTPCASCVRHVCVICTSHGQNMPFLHAQNFPKRARLGKIVWLIDTTVLCAEIVHICGIAAASTLTKIKDVTF